jgi:Arc/MetJ family transcription regulator
MGVNGPACSRIPLLDPRRHFRLVSEVDRQSTALTYDHTGRMVSHMKTTLNIDDSVMARLKREAARSGRTMSELVESALRNLLGKQPDREQLPPLPSFDGGGALVKIADRDSLYSAMEGR